MPYNPGYLHKNGPKMGSQALNKDGFDVWLWQCEPKPENKAATQDNYATIKHHH